MKSTTAGGTNSPGASKRPGRSTHSLQREAQLVAGTPPGSDVLQVFVAQGVVAQQVGLALRKGKQGRPCRSPTALSRAGPPARVFSQSLDLQRDALRAECVEAINLYHDLASGVRDDRPGLDSCLRALRKGDVLVVWKLDRLGRNLAHLVERPSAGPGYAAAIATAATRTVDVFALSGARGQVNRPRTPSRRRAGRRRHAPRTSSAAFSGPGAECQHRVVRGTAAPACRCRCRRSGRASRARPSRRGPRFLAVPRCSPSASGTDREPPSYTQEQEFGASACEGRKPT